MNDNFTMCNNNLLQDKYNINNEENIVNINNKTYEENITSKMIYRFKLSREMTNLIFEFSKIHQYDDR